MVYLVIAFIVVSALEIGLLVLASDLIGVWPTIALIILTGIVGGALAKKQGAEVIKLAQLQLQRGEIPSEAILDGICVLTGGILLVTPGFISDFTGFMLLIPFTRSILKILLRKLIKKGFSRKAFFYMKR